MTSFIDQSMIFRTSLVAVICMVLVYAVRFFPRLGGRAEDMVAVQCAHSKITPRVGGVALAIGLLSIQPTLAPDMALTFGALCLSAVVIFGYGLGEDLGYGVSVKNRFIASLVSCFMAYAVLDMGITHTHIAPLDAALSVWLVGAVVTVLLSAGFANALNMIDGVNGLAAGTVLVASIAFGVIAAGEGADEMVPVFFLMAACLLGFLFVNYPTGKIFLGDAGAYTLGFMIAWMGIVLVNKTGISAWSAGLVLIWPIADLLLAIYRRSLRGKARTAPDRLHFHQFVMRALEIHVLGRSRRNLANPLTTALLAPFIIAPAILGVIYRNDPVLSLVLFWVFLGLFFATYLLGFRVRRMIKKGVFVSREIFPVLSEKQVTLEDCQTLEQESPQPPSVHGGDSSLRFAEIHRKPASS